VALVAGDSAVGGKHVRADKELRELAQSMSVELVAWGSQPRPSFHGPSKTAFGSEPRREHLLVFRRAAESVSRREPPRRANARTAAPRRPRKPQRRRG
jgi:hypothetical protein